MTPHTADDFGSPGPGETSERLLTRAAEIDGGAGWAAGPVGFDFDPTGLGFRFHPLSTGRNRQLDSTFSIGLSTRVVS